MNRQSLLLPASLSLRQRLTLYYALAFIILLGLTFIALYWSISAILIDRMQEDLIEDVEEFSQILNVSGQAAVIAEMGKETAADESENVFLQLYSISGELIHSTSLEHWPSLNVDVNLLSEVLKQPSDVTLAEVSLPTRNSVAQAVVGRLSPTHTLLIGESVEDYDEITELLATVFTLIFFVALPITALMVWLLTSKAVTGINEVSNAAQQIRAGNLNTRVNMVDQVAEVQTLADTFDSMAQRIQSLIRNMREMTDNIAHDLRSPLGRIRLLSESLLQSQTDSTSVSRTAEASITECDRLIRMIDLSLDVAETEAGVGQCDNQPLNFTQLVRDACEHFDAIAEQKGIELAFSAYSDYVVSGQTNSLQRMVANLLDNALKYSHNGGRVSVSLGDNGSTVKLTIQDSGIGIPACAYETIFQRFYRIDPSRSDEGCGLGLSYARAVARNHSGDITVSSVEGQFCLFTVTLPVLSTSQNNHNLKNTAATPVTL